MSDPTAAIALPEPITRAARAGHRNLRKTVADLGGTPLRNGNSVTLVHYGVADGVDVRHWLDIAPEIPTFERFEDSDLWWTSFEIPPDARIEYKISIRRGDRHRLQRDPFNSIGAPNPWGINSVLAGCDYEPPAWTIERPDAASGTITRLEVDSAVYNATRVMQLYVPPAGDEFPLLIVHDGGDYLAYAGLGTVLDNLIADGAIPPVAAVLTEPFDRMSEYRGNNRHVTHLIDEVLPVVEAKLRIVRRIAMGASLGGVASLHASWMRPGVFDALVLQAGSFVDQLGGPFHRSHAFDPVIRFLKQFGADHRTLPGRIHLSCGRFDGLINETRGMARYFADNGVDVAYTDVAAGHDWHAWRDMLRHALIHTLATTG